VVVVANTLGRKKKINGAISIKKNSRQSSEKKQKK
jgi:hypothetical protein